MRNGLIVLLVMIFALVPGYAQQKEMKDPKVQEPAQEVTPMQAEQVLAEHPLADGQSQVLPQQEPNAPQVQDLAAEVPPAQPAAEGEVINPEAEEGFVAAREEQVEEQPVVVLEQRVVFNPKNQRDPTLSPDDFLLLQYREQQRLAAIEAERQRKLAEERRKREEAERLRQLELERIKDPTREVRNKIRVGGVIGQEVFIGSKIYTVGNTIFGARIVEVHPDYVIFSYKGHRFRRNVQL